MLNLRNKKIFILTLLFIVFPLVLILTIYKAKNSSNADVPEKDTSLFNTSQNLNPSQIAELSKYSDAITEMNKIFVNPTDYWKNWYIGRSLVVARVKSVFPEFNEATINILLPSNQPFSAKQLRVGLNCTDAGAVVLKSGSYDFIRTTANISEELTENDLLYAQCQKVSNCEKMQGTCIIVRDIDAN